jgi:hypothetical protein
MKRTQIYLDDQTYEYLRHESQARHVTISEVIRESITEKMGRKVQQTLKAVERISGIWMDRDFDVDQYVRTARKDRKAW